MADVTISYKGATIATMDASGSKTLDTKGKYCEDNITVSVDVDIHTKVVSLSSDVTAGSATLLIGNAFVKANYSNSKFFCGFARVQTDADTSGQYVSSGFASNFYNHLNRYYCCWGGSETSLKTWSSAGDGYKASANYTGTGYAHVHADSSGNIVAHAPSSYTIKAGTYIVWYGLAN